MVACRSEKEDADGVSKETDRRIISVTASALDLSEYKCVAPPDVVPRNSPLRLFGGLGRREFTRCVQPTFSLFLQLGSLLTKNPTKNTVKQTRHYAHLPPDPAGAMAAREGSSSCSRVQVLPVQFYAPTSSSLSPAASQ